MVLVFAISIICGMIIWPVSAGTHVQVLNPRSQGNSVSHMNTRHGTDHITVMTMNLYVGADVDQILAAQNPAQIPFLVAQAFQKLLATNFFERAEAIADQIQSATIWRCNSMTSACVACAVVARSHLSLRLRFLRAVVRLIANSI